MKVDKSFKTMFDSEDLSDVEEASKSLPSCFQRKMEEGDFVEECEIFKDFKKIQELKEEEGLLDIYTMMRESHFRENYFAYGDEAFHQVDGIALGGKLNAEAKVYKEKIGDIVEALESGSFLDQLDAIAEEIIQTTSESSSMNLLLPIFEDCEIPTSCINVRTAFTVKGLFKGDFISSFVNGDNIKSKIELLYSEMGDVGGELKIRMKEFILTFFYLCLALEIRDKDEHLARQKGGEEGGVFLFPNLYFDGWPQDLVTMEIGTVVASEYLSEETFTRAKRQTVPICDIFHLIQEIGQVAVEKLNPLVELIKYSTLFCNYEIVERMVSEGKEFESLLGVDKNSKLLVDVMTSSQEENY
jgi:hypothetical protein